MHLSAFSLRPALQRSRDELLAMLNVTDRKTWEHECWGQSPDEFAQFSSIEVCDVPYGMLTMFVLLWERK